MRRYQVHMLVRGLSVPVLGMETEHFCFRILGHQKCFLLRSGLWLPKT